MGYTTEFSGHFVLNKKLDEKTRRLVEGLQRTRRMKRSVIKLAEMTGLSVPKAKERYGIDGEFYFNEDDFENFGQRKDPSIVDFNTPPSTQPSLWLKWEYDESIPCFRWDGSEKFYNYVEWLEYLINKILAPRGYVLNGEVTYQGEDIRDRGTIKVDSNKVVKE